MKKYLFALLTLALVAVPVGQAHAGGLSVIRLNDETKDAWVWVTAYEKVPFGRTIRAAYCVAPQEKSERRIGDIIDEVRVEVTSTNCAHPVYLDSTLGTGGGMNSGKGLVIRAFQVRGSGGRYSFDTIGSQ
jgi:hypothetical protein